MEKQLASTPPTQLPEVTTMSTLITQTTTITSTTTSVWDQQPNAKLKVASSSAPQARNCSGGERCFGPTNFILV